MKDGNYDIRLKLDGFDGEGAIDLKGNHGFGGSTRFRIELQVGQFGPSATGSLNVSMDQRIVGNRSVPSCYTVALTGTIGSDQFSLIGIGPVGLIVEIVGQRSLHG